MIRFVQQHPAIASWIVLSIGFLIMLFLAARDVGLLPQQMAALAVSTIILAGLCVWIINWER